MSRVLGSGMLWGCAALLVLTSAASAQTKVAVISLQRAVLESDEIQKVSQTMETKYKPRQQKIEELQRDLQGIAAESALWPHRMKYRVFIRNCLVNHGDLRSFQIVLSKCGPYSPHK